MKKTPLVVRKAVLPVAGLGTRMLPATKAIPKEMLPVVDKPLIQYVVREAIAAGIKEIIMSIENKKNIDEIQDIYLKGLTFHYVNDIKEVFAIALTNEKVADAIDLSVKKPSQE